MWMNLPSPYPDETVLSIISRWKFRTGILTRRETFSLLVGKPDLRFEAILDYLNIISQHTDMGAGELENRHTLRPFSHAFYPRYFGAISNINHVGSDSTLSICPICLSEDSKTFGEPYWHRVHQIPHVLVCPEHGVLLQEVCPKCSLPIGIAGDLHPPKLWCSCGHFFSDYSVPCDHTHLYEISTACNLILNQRLDVDADDLKQFYMAYLYRTALKSHPEVDPESRIHHYMMSGGGFWPFISGVTDALMYSVVQHFGSDMLKEIGIDRPLIIANDPFSNELLNFIVFQDDFSFTTIYHILIGLYLYENDFVSFLEDVRSLSQTMHKA